MKKPSKFLILLKKLFIFVFFLLIFALFVLLPRIIPINKLKCTSQYGPCNAEVFAEVSKWQGKNYLKASKEITKILSSSQYVNQFSLKFVLPDRLNINLIEKKPSIALPSVDGKFLLVNQDGMVVDVVDETLLPKIQPTGELSFNFNKGQEVSEDIKFAINVMQKIYYVYNISEAIIADDSLTFTLSDGKKVIFPLVGDIDVLFGSLQLILSRLNTEGNYSIIDLRFKNPVLR